MNPYYFFILSCKVAGCYLIAALVARLYALWAIFGWDERLQLDLIVWALVSFPDTPLRMSIELYNSNHGLNPIYVGTMTVFGIVFIVSLVLSILIPRRIRKGAS